MAKKTYKATITLQKFGISLIEIFLAGAVVYCTERPEFLLLVPILEALRNWLKNRNK